MALMLVFVNYGNGITPAYKTNVAGGGVGGPVGDIGGSGGTAVGGKYYW